MYFTFRQVNFQNNNSWIFKDEKQKNFIHPWKWILRTHSLMNKKRIPIYTWSHFYVAYTFQIFFFSLLKKKRILDVQICWYQTYSNTLLSYTLIFIFEHTSTILAWIIQAFSLWPHLKGVIAYFNLNIKFTAHCFSNAW